MKTIKLKNNTVAADYWIGVQIQPGEYYQLQNETELSLAILSTKLNTDLWSGALLINDGTNDLTASNGDLYLKDREIKKIEVQSSPSFGSKTFYSGTTLKKLYARFTGQQFTLAVGANTLDYTIVYPWVKMVGLELIGGEIGDIASLKVVDTAAGTYSGVPNYVLNQFGYSVNVAKDFYARASQFDSDLYPGMIIRLEYGSMSIKTIGVNYLINEVKS